MHIDHVGIATEDASDLADLYADLFDAPVAHQEEFDGLQVVFLEFGDSYFELLEPLEGGTVQKYLDSNGPGIHHVAVETDDIEAALDTARSHSVELSDDEPRPGAWGHVVAWLLPRTTGGVLI